MRTFSKSLMLLLAAGVMLIYVPLAGAQATKTDVVMFIQQEPASLNPITDNGDLYVASLVRSTIFAPMVDLNDKWQYFPVIAQKIPTLKDGDWKLLPGDKMQVTWKLKKGFTWHDGKPVTAEDFIFSWRVHMDPNVPVSGRDVARRVENMLAPDPYTLVVQWKKKYAFANWFWGSSLMPKHVIDRQFRANPSKFDQAPWSNGVPTVGAGPYVLKEWQKGSSITVEAYDKYQGPRPAVKRITFRFISDTNTIIANVLSGAADATDETAIPFISGLELEQRLQRENRNDVIAKPQPGLVWEHIDLNNDNIHLKDKRVRQALITAINREQLVTTLFEGKQVVSHAFLPEKHYGYLKDVKKYAFDPARARALLAEAGYRPGSDGIMVSPSGVRLSLIFMTTAGNRTREAVQQILQSQWRDVGIEVRINNQPARVYFGDTLPARKFEMAMYAWVFSPTSDCEGLYTGDTIPTEANREGQNYPGYKNDELTKLCHAVPEELDTAKRVQMLQRAQQIWVEDLPTIPLYLRSDYTVHKAALQGWKPTGAGSPVTWNAGTEWRWTR